MSRVLRWIAAVLLVLAIACGLGFRYLTAREDPPASSSYALDLAEVRRLASAPPGARPSHVRSLLVHTAEVPRAAVFAGESFEPHTMVHQVFQLVFPDASVLIDSGFGPEGFAESMDGELDAEAVSQVARAIEGARATVITHEHADHIGGIAEHPRPASLIGRVLLTAEQLSSSRWLDHAGSPEVLRQGLEPLRYDRYHALAPGVVLIKAAGHSPGSQIVYVGLADGRELLFLGDVVWHMDAIRNLHYRPRFVTDWILGEDRSAVLNQIRRLHDLMSEEPELRLVVSHDPSLRQSLLESGWLIDGFGP